MKKFITICLIAIILVGSLALCVNAFKTPDIIGYETYVVKSGDTLWGIAKNSNGWNRMDAYEIIDAMEEASNCTALIYPGQIIYVPIYDIGGK